MTTGAAGQQEAVMSQTSSSKIVNGGDGGDVLTGGNGDDTLNGGLGDDTLDGGSGNDSLNGCDGSDTASYASSALAVTVDLRIQGTQQDTLGAGRDTLISIESLVGSHYNDHLTGDDQSNRLDGGGGMDVLEGGGR